MTKVFKTGTVRISLSKKQLLRTSALTVMGVMAASAPAFAVGDKEIPVFNSFGETSADTTSLSVSSDTANGILGVTQHGARAVYNWDTFNLGKDAKATFTMDNAGAIAVNRVVGPQSDPSTIMGQLSSNGKVVILDRNGVVFSGGSKVNVAGLVASTGDIANAADFVAGGNLVLNNVNANPGASVSNAGAITIADSGLLAFVAPYAANSGTITAKLGKVTLASGSKVTLDFTGDELVQIAVSDKVDNGLVENSGAIIANGGIVTMTANTAKTALDTVVNMTGVIQADSFSTVTGKIVLGSGGAKTHLAGTLRSNSNSPMPAGTVKIGGGAVDIDATKIIGAHLSIDAPVINLGGAIVASNNTLITDAARFDSTAAAVNVLNDNASIQQGLNLAATGGAVTVGEGYYAGNITITRGVTLQGDLNGKFAPVLEGTKANGRVISVLADNVTVQGLEINGGTNPYEGEEGTGVESDTGIYAKGVHGLQIANNFIHNVLRDGIFITDSGKAKVSPPSEGGDTEQPLQALVKTASAGITITDNRIDDTGRDGIEISDSAGILAEDNVIGGTIGGAYGIGRRGITVTGSSSRDIALNDNYIYDTVGDGINVTNGANISVTDNELDRIGQDGIDFDGTNGVTITGNSIDGTTENGIEVNRSTGSVAITDNLLQYLGEHGIALGKTNGATISGNGIVGTGYNWSFYGNANGITVRNSDGVTISGNGITDAALDGIHAENANALSITGNIIAGTDIFSTDGAYRDGLNISGTDGSTVDGNYILGSAEAGAYGADRDGIHIEGASDTTVTNNVISVIENVDFASLLAPFLEKFGDKFGSEDTYAPEITSFDEEGGGYEYYDGYGASRDGILLADGKGVTIGSNTVNYYGDDGVQVSDSDAIVIDGNAIDGSAYGGNAGIRLGDNNDEGCGEASRCDGKDLKSAFFIPSFDGDYTGNGDVTVSNNTVSGNFTGLSATAFNNGGITVSGNTFSDNVIGANFGSGLIDLSGKANTFNFGDTALLFQRSTAFSFIPEGPTEGGNEDGFQTESLEGSFGLQYAQLDLVGNTLGSTVFSGQSSWYVDLENGSLFAPGSPTVIDGTQATYDGVSGGLMTSAQLASIESMLHDYIDDNTEGLIFPGFTTGGGIDNNDVFHIVGDASFLPGNPYVIITGLPKTGGGGTGPLAYNANNLANIEPAAGGDLNNVQPGAGGGTTEAACWGNISPASLTGKTVVTLNLGGDAGALLNAQAACGGGSGI